MPTPNGTHFLIPTDGGQIVAINENLEALYRLPKTGSVGPLRSHVLYHKLTDGRTFIYALSNNGIFYAFDLATGEIAWRQTVDQPRTDTRLPDPVLDPETGVIYVPGTMSGGGASGIAAIKALKADTGELASVPFLIGAQRIETSPILARVNGVNTLFFGASDGRFYALRVDNFQQPYWTVNLSTRAFNIGPVLDVTQPNGQGNLYIATTEGMLFSLTTEGFLKWTVATGQAMHAPLRLEKAAGLLYAGSDDSDIHTFQLTDGQEVPALRYQVSVDAPFRAQSRMLKAGDGNVYLFSGRLNGYFYAFLAGDPGKVYEYNANQEGQGQFWSGIEVTNPTTQDALLVTNTNGYVYKFQLQ